MADDQTATDSDGRSDAATTTSVEGSPAARSRNSPTEREWRGDWQLPVGALGVILVLALVLWLLQRGS